MIGRALNNLFTAAALLGVLTIAVQGQSTSNRRAASTFSVEAPLPATSERGEPYNFNQAPAEPNAYIRDPAPPIKIRNASCTMSRARAISYWEMDIQKIQSVSGPGCDERCMKRTFGDTYEPLVKSLEEGSYRMDPPAAYVEAIQARLEEHGRATFLTQGEKSRRPK
jgi:hypothetical protein